MKKFYSPQLGAVIYDESNDPCSLGCNPPQMSGAPQMGNVRYFQGRSDGMGNVKYFPGSMGNYPAQMGASLFDNFSSAVQKGIQQALPGVSKEVLNQVLSTPEGQQIVANTSSAAMKLGEQQAAAQAAKELAELQTSYQQQLQSAYQASKEAIAKNWKTILLIGGGLAALGIVIYMTRSSSRPATAANPRRRRSRR
jgi:hypothetical protein